MNKISQQFFSVFNLSKASKHNFKSFCLLPKSLALHRHKPGDYLENKREKSAMLSSFFFVFCETLNNVFRCKTRDQIICCQLILTGRHPGLLAMAGFLLKYLTSLDRIRRRSSGGTRGPLLY